MVPPNSGLFTYPHSHTQLKLGSTVEAFLEEIKQMHSAHIFMMVGFPNPEGKLKLTSLVMRLLFHPYA